MAWRNVEVTWFVNFTHSLIFVSFSSMQLSANYVRVKCKNRHVYQYHVDFQPEIDSKSMRFRLLAEFRELIGPTKAFDGFILYLPKELEQQVSGSFNELILMVC